MTDGLCRMLAVNPRSPEPVWTGWISDGLDGRVHWHDSAITNDWRHRMRVSGHLASRVAGNAKDRCCGGMDSRRGCIGSSLEPRPCVAALRRVAAQGVEGPVRQDFAGHMSRVRRRARPVEVNEKRPCRAVFRPVFGMIVGQAALARCAVGPAIEARADFMAAVFCASPTASPSARTNSTRAMPMSQARSAGNSPGSPSRRTVPRGSCRRGWRR